MIQLILCILILISLIIYTKFYIENFKSPQDACDFNSSNLTYNDCLNMCKTNSCNDTCSKKCDNIYITQVNDRTKSDSVKLKSEWSSYNSIKLSWFRPISIFDIDKYYIVLSKNNKNNNKNNNKEAIEDAEDAEEYEVYILEDDKEYVEYYINEIDYTDSYDIYVIVKNVMGSISDKSDTVYTSKLTYSFQVSISNLNKNENTDAIKSRKPLYSRNVIYNDIIQILNKKLDNKPLKGIYNINIY